LTLSSQPKAQRIRHLSSVKRKQSEEAVGGTALATSVDMSLPSVTVVEPEPVRTVHLTKKEKIFERRESFLRSEPFDSEFSFSVFIASIF